MDYKNDRLLRTDEVAKILGLDVSTLRRWRAKEDHNGLPFIRISYNKVRYAYSDVLKFVNQKANREVFDKLGEETVDESTESALEGVKRKLLKLFEK